jgi:hypothetical protein
MNLSLFVCVDGIIISQNPIRLISCKPVTSKNCRAFVRLALFNRETINKNKKLDEVKKKINQS